MSRAIEGALEEREALEPSIEELKATGTIVVIESFGDFLLSLDSLQRYSTHRKTPKRPQWLLLSVSTPIEEQPEQAVVWINDDYRKQFMQLLENYIEKNTAKGNPQNRALVANMATIRRAVLSDLWRSDGLPPRNRERWWELWLRPEEGALEALAIYARALSLAVSERQLLLDDRVIVWIRSTWDDLQGLPFTTVPIAEVRYPQFVDTFEDFRRDEQDEFTEDLAARVIPAPNGAPAVCHLDTGVRYSHLLLRSSLDVADVHSVVGDPPGDQKNHGTRMAGLALYGDLDEALSGTQPIQLSHKLESVKILPDRATADDPLAYGIVTAQAVAAPEITSARRRVFCMPVTTYSESSGQPSLWSAAVDALAVGVDIGRSPTGIELLGMPDPAARRLFLISAGNVSSADYQQDYRSVCDISGVAEPAQAWNALTVGAFTNLTRPSDDPTFHGWKPLASEGDISPHSRTSVAFSHRKWPIKPEICMEGGNFLTDGTDFHNFHPVLSVRTTENGDDLAVGSANATSAATAQAANLAARLWSLYPEYWPETVRALLTHSAEWTPLMRTEIDGVVGKREKHVLLRRYGWGVPDKEEMLSSTRRSVKMVTQDEFQPFEGNDHKVRHFRLHSLPWPVEVLDDLGADQVKLRVTLSYFVEPTASRRGWRRRYAYASHGLRFELKAPLETQRDFVARVNRDAEDEESRGARPSGQPDRWLLGANQRNQGSLHQDIWEGTGADLARCGMIAVYAIGGWWKNNGRTDRADLPVRYSLVISLKTDAAGVDLYTPIATTLAAPVQVLTPGA